MQWMYEERLLKDYTSSQELISKFVASRVCGCTYETHGVRDDVGVTECTIEARGMRDVSPELNLARLHLGLNRKLHDGQNGVAR